MAGAWVRAPSIGRMAPFRALCEAATSAAADVACLGCGSAARIVVRLCIGRLSVVAGTARAHWCSPFAAVCWAEVLPVTAAEAGRALGPMLPASARELWPLRVLRGFVSRSSAGSARFDVKWLGTPDWRLSPPPIPRHTCG